MLETLVVNLKCFSKTALKAERERGRERRREGERELDILSF